MRLKQYTPTVICLAVFHLSANIWEKYEGGGGGGGGRGAYSSVNGEFGVHVRMIMALVFVPVAEVENAFEDLSHEIRNLLISTSELYWIILRAPIWEE